MSLLVHCISSLCVREFLVSQLVILVVLYFTLLVSLALHLVLLKFIRFPLLLLFCSSLVPVFSFFKPLVWFLSLFRFFCLSQFLFQLSIPSICLLVHFLVLFALCSLNLFFFVLFFLVIVCSECLILLLMVSLVVLSCVLCVVLCLVCSCSVSWFPLAAVLKTWLSDWTGFITAQSIKPWLLKLLPDFQRSHWLVLLYLLCSPAKLCPGLTSAILLFSSRLPFPTVWTLTSALLILVLSIYITMVC